MITSNSRVHGLWKSVENEGKPWRACSGCAGDYEDPDRSAWEEEFEEEEAGEVGMSQEVVTERGAVAPWMELQAARMKRKRRTQRAVLLDVLRIAAQYETWVTLAELAEKTKFPPASISAQLRHLRKEKYGAWKVERRRREWAKEELVWEYRLGI